MSDGVERASAPGPASDGVPPRILLVDCDAFYVQVARLEDPDGIGREKLLLVGGSASGRGVVTSASYEVRAFGVRSGMPTAQALRLCPDAVVVPVPRDACSRRSREVRRALEELSPVVQQASIDEFYLDLAGTERLFGSETFPETADRIRGTVLKRSSVSVSIGGGTNRLIAKMAARRAKPAGVHIVAPGAEQDFLLEHSLAEIPGIGPSFVEALRRRGLVQVGDALPVEPEWLSRWFGERRGSWLYRRIRGVDRTAVRRHEPRKSISSERTFARDIYDAAELERQLTRLAGSVARTLRSKSLRARTVTVKVRDLDFTTRQTGYTLPDAVESDAVVSTVARTLLAEMRKRRGGGVRLLGVGLSNLVDSDEPVQLALFEPGSAAETDRDRRVSRVMDDLTHRFGDGVVRTARALSQADRRGTDRI